MHSYVAFEVRRILRTPRFLLLTMVVPIAMNIVFVQLNGGNLPADKLQAFATGYMMNMATFATLSACLTIAGNRLAQERGSGWFSYLTLTPLRPVDIVGGKILSAILLGVPAVLGVFISGVVVNHVPLDPAHLAMALGVVVVGSTVFAALGVVIGLVTRQESSYAAAMTVLMLFSIVGGLWMPREMMPDWLAAITTWTPSFQIADTGKAIMSGLSAAPVQAGAVFTVWTALFVALALVAFRRSASSR